jgi:hypothetical protein
LLQDQLLQFRRRWNESDITALFDDPPNPPVDVVLLEDVLEPILISYYNFIYIYNYLFSFIFQMCWGRFYESANKKIS